MGTKGEKLNQDLKEMLKICRPSPKGTDVDITKEDITNELAVTGSLSDKSESK